jgi:hypothetical protein
MQGMFSYHVKKKKSTARAIAINLKQMVLTIDNTQGHQ